MKKNGFSFIELIVVIGIMMSITGFVVSNYNNFNGLEKLRQAGKTLRTNLRYAQTHATSGVKPASCTTANQSLLGYSVIFTNAAGNNPARYVIRAVCSGGVTWDLPIVELPRDVVYSSLPPTITFRVLTGTINTTTSVTLSSVGRTYTIQVSPSGDINDLGLL